MNREQRRKLSEEERRKLAKDVTAGLVDDGAIIEAGFLGYRLHVIPDNASETQVAETKKAFFAGAHHLFASIMSFLDPGTEPTERDERRMSRIHDELEKFLKEFKQQHPLEKGH